MHRTRLNASGHFCEIEAAVDLLDSGYISIRWAVVAANFSVQWANPLWEVLGWEPTTQVPLVARSLRRSADELRGTSALETIRWSSSASYVAQGSSDQLGSELHRGSFRLPSALRYFVVLSRVRVWLAGVFSYDFLT